MKIGISTWCFRQQPLEEALRAIAHMGIKYVELFANIFHLDPRSAQVDVQRLTSVLHRNGLVLSSLHAPFAGIDGGGSKTAAKRAWQGLMVETLALMASLQVPSVIVHPQAMMLSAGEKPHPLELAQEVLGEIIGQAQTQGIEVLMENLNPLIATAFHTLGEIGDLMQGMGDTRSGFCFDTSHCIISGRDPVVEFNQNHERIRQIHLSDNIYAPRSDRHLALGSGCIDWTAFIESLRQKRFNGALILEIDGGKDPSEALQHSLAFLGKLV